MKFYSRGELYRRLRKLKSIINWTDDGLATLLDGKDHNEIIENARIKYQKELEEYSKLKKLYEKLNEIKKNPVDCPCCGYRNLKHVAISDDGQHVIGPECANEEHPRPCDRFREEKQLVSV